MEDEGVTYSPKRREKKKAREEEEEDKRKDESKELKKDKKRKKPKSAAATLFPDSRYSNLFRESDDEEGESDDEEDGLAGARETLSNAKKTASAKQTSRLDGIHIVYEDTWKNFREKPAHQIIEEEYHPLESGYVASEEEKARADAAKQADFMAWRRWNKIASDGWRKVIDKIIGRNEMRPEDVYNGLRTDVPRTTFELPEVLGLESIAHPVADAISEAFSKIIVRYPQSFEKVEDIVFSDNAVLIDQFVELVWIGMKIKSYHNGLRPTLESKISNLESREYFCLRAIGQTLSQAERHVAPFLPSYFPRTSGGYKRARVSLT